MANEVFISYSRKDYEIVKAVKDEIDSLVGIDCWMDLNGIESGEWFKSVIISAINSHDTLLFMLTPNSMISPFAMKELGFAAKKGKRIVLVDLKNTQLNDDFLFDYSDKDNIDWNDSLQHDKLIANLRIWFPLNSQKKNDKVDYPVFFSKKENPVIHVLFLIDSSGSMMGRRMEEVNQACSDVFNTLNIINPDVDIKVNVLSFSSEVNWICPNPVSIEDFTWISLKAQGLTSFGWACSELDSKMSTNEFFKTLNGIHKSLIILITDGEPTDNFETPLQILQRNQFFQKANRFAIGIGEDFNERILARFAGNKRVFTHTDDNASKLKPLLERIIHIGLYAASYAALDDEF